MRRGRLQEAPHELIATEAERLADSARQNGTMATGQVDRAKDGVYAVTGQKTAARRAYARVVAQDRRLAENGVDTDLDRAMFQL